MTPKQELVITRLGFALCVVLLIAFAVLSKANKPESQTAHNLVMEGLLAHLEERKQ